MTDPTTHTLAWRLARLDERERRAAEHDLGALVARWHRWRRRWTG